MSKPEYDALVDDIVKLTVESNDSHDDDARAIVALIRERLSKPTEAMVEAWLTAETFSHDAHKLPRLEYGRLRVKRDLNAMLDASALTPGSD